MATIFQSGATKLLTPMFVASVGSILGAIIIFFILLSSGKLPSLKKIKENKFDLTTMTIFRFILGVAIFAYALSMTTGIKAIFFTKAEPYFVLLWFWLLQKGEIKKQHVALLGIHIIGAILLSTGGVLEFGMGQLGDLLVIIAMGFFSISYIPGKKLSTSMGSKQSNFVTMGLGGLVLLPFALFLSPSSVWNVFSLGWTYFLAWIILFNVIGLTMWFAALKTVKGWMVSALRAVGPIAGAPLAWLLFGEMLTPMQIVGGLIVLFTSVIIAKEHLKSKI